MSELLGNEKIPQGIVAILTSPDGRELASASDFNTGRPAGFSQKQAQEIRARRSLAFEAMKKLSSPLLSNAIDAYDAEKHVGANLMHLLYLRSLQNESERFERANSGLAG